MQKQGKQVGWSKPGKQESTLACRASKRASRLDRAAWVDTDRLFTISSTRPCCSCTSASESGDCTRKTALSLTHTHARTHTHNTESFSIVTEACKVDSDGC